MRAIRNGRRLHELAHEGKVEYLILTPEDALRKRLRATTDQGTECTITLPRDQRLDDGAILELGGQAIVVRMTDQRWLPLEAPDEAAALELGYFCGNLHWRVRFDNKRILVAMEGPEDDYLARLEPLLARGTARKAVND